MFNFFKKKKDDKLAKARAEITFLRLCLQHIVDSDSGAVPGGYHEFMAEEFLAESRKRYP